jgi:hypothetical protein
MLECYRNNPKEISRNVSIRNIKCMDVGVLEVAKPAEAHVLSVSASSERTLLDAFVDV